MQANAMPFCLVCYTLCSGFYFPMQEIDEYDKLLVINTI